MGVSQASYLGSYIKITKSKFDAVNVKTVCVNQECKLYEKETTSNYCSACGTVIQPKEIIETIDFSLYRLEDKYDIEDDTLYSPECTDFILPQFDGTHAWDEGEINIINNIPTSASLFLHPEWVKVINALESENIPYERCYGMVTYWA